MRIGKTIKIVISPKREIRKAKETERPIPVEMPKVPERVERVEKVEAFKFIGSWGMKMYVAQDLVYAATS
jgi:hypothetical protein